MSLMWRGILDIILDENLNVSLNCDRINQTKWVKLIKLKLQRLEWKKRQTTRTKCDYFIKNDVLSYFTLSSVQTNKSRTTHTNFFFFLSQLLSQQRVCFL